MPKLPLATGSEIVKTLRRAGFVFRNQVGSHVILKHPETQATVSVPVHSGRDVPPGTLRRILRDAGLTIQEFQQLLK